MKKVRVAEVNGKWGFEVTTKKGTYRTEFSTQQLAEEFLDFYNKYYYKKVMLKNDKDITEPVRVTEISFVYDNGEGNPPTKELMISWKGSRYRVLAENCVLV